MRTFVAVELPAPARRLLLDLQRRLERTLRDAHAGGLVRWTDAQNLHLTLRFLGETSVAQRDIVEGQLTSRVSQFPAFDLTLHDLGVFPNWRRPNIVWVGFAGATAHLALVQGAVEQAVTQADFAAEDRPFSPHLTIGRIKKDANTPDRQRLGEILQQEQGRSQTLLAAAAAQFTVDAIALIQSDLRPSGPVYTTLSSYSLKG